MTAPRNVVKGPQTSHRHSVTTGGGIYALLIAEEGPQRSSNRTGDSHVVTAPTRSPIVAIKVAKGPQIGHAPKVTDPSAPKYPKVPKVDSDAVTHSAVTASDNSDSVPCPNLGTFRPEKSVQRSPKVPSHAVTVVTTLSPRNSDSVSGRSGDVCPVKQGQRSPNLRASWLGDLCPDFNMVKSGQTRLMIMESQETLSPCHSIPAMSAETPRGVMGALKMQFGTIYQLLDVDIVPGHSIFADSDSPRNTDPSDRVTASPGDL